MQVFIRILVVACITMTTIGAQANHEKKETIEKITSPIGQVHLEKEKSDTAQASSVKAEPRTGEVIYNSLCIACHSTGLANAPKMGDNIAWGKLLETAGIDGLISSAKAGKNVMPAMGNCADCSDDELKSTIEFMSGISN